MSYQLRRDTTVQQVINRTDEVSLFTQDIPAGLWVGNAIVMEQTAVYCNGNASARTYTIRGRLNDQLLFTCTAATQGQTTNFLSAVQRWHLGATATNQIRGIMRYEQGGDGAARTLSTSAAADDIIDATGHGFVIGDAVVFTSLTGGSGLTVGTTYWVISANFGADTFQVATTQGGSAVNFTTDITAGSVRIAGSNNGSFGTVTTPGGGGTVRFGDVNFFPTDPGYVDLGKPTQLGITVQLNNTGATHEFRSLDFTVVVITNALNPSVRPQPLRKVGV